MVKAIALHWKNQRLDDAFRSLRSNTSSDVLVLFDTEATAGTPFPYCVFEMTDSTPVSGMSGDRADEVIKHIESSYQLRVHAPTKEMASKLAKQIIEAFTYPIFRMTEGNYIDTRYETDLCVRDGENNQWLWAVRLISRFASRSFIGSS